MADNISPNTSQWLANILFRILPRSVTIEKKDRLYIVTKSLPRPGNKSHAGGTFVIKTSSVH
jgi:hypothetical protein